MTSKTYTINEIFVSIQGEGVRVGTANLFLRFTGCNLTCNTTEHGFDCDTEFLSGRKLTAAEIVSELRECNPKVKAIILTGGEPALQVDADLIAALKSEDYFLAIETNGTRELPPLLDWITVSPKTAEHTLRQSVAHEVKYVRAYGQALPRPTIDAPHKLISPACQAAGVYLVRDLDWCVAMVKENPEWKLSIQTHKLLRLR